MSKKIQRKAIKRINHLILSKHWGFDDPAKAVGTDEDICHVFQRVRDQIQSRIQTFEREGK